MARGFCAAASALLLLAACGPTSWQGASPPAPPTGALAAWKDFPAAGNPRPVVWLFTRSPITGLESTSKMATYCNKLALAEGLHLPAAAAESATALWPSGVSASYPPLSATEAFAAMTRPPTDVNSGTCAGVAPVTVTAVRLATSGIGTDRGTAQMPAWLFSVVGVRGELAYPALAPSAFWGGRMARNSGSNATVSADERVLTFSFTGAPSIPGPCGADYTVSLAESSSAVAIAVKAIPHGAVNGDTVCTARGEVRTLTLQLSAALGGRVVVDAREGVVAVCPEAAASLPVGATARC